MVILRIGPGTVMVFRWPGLMVMRFVAMRSALGLAGIVPGRNRVLRPDFSVAPLNAEVATSEVSDDLAAADDCFLLCRRVRSGARSTPLDVPAAVRVCRDDTVVLLHRIPLGVYRRKCRA